MSTELEVLATNSEGKMIVSSVSEMDVEFVAAFRALFSNEDLLKKFHTDYTGQHDYSDLVWRSCEWAFDNHQAEDWSFLESAECELNQKLNNEVE